MAHRNLKIYTDECPKIFSYNTGEKQMGNRVLIRAENTVMGFYYMSLPQVVSSHKFVMGKQPEEHMNFLGDPEFPDSRGENRLNPANYL